MIKKAKKYLEKREFARNVLTLMTGTTIAQAIPIAISPILTRLYTPDDFGVLALFMSITAITGSIANAKYEQAIVLPKKDSDAINIVALGIAIAIFISIFLLLIVLLFNDFIVAKLGNDQIRPWLYLVPLSILLLGIFNSLNFYNIRKKKFKNISISQVTKSSSLGIIQVGIGLIKSSPLGLVLGQLTSYFSGNLILFKALKEHENWLQVIQKKRIKQMIVEYKKFPLYSMPSVFINSVNLNMVNILISSFFSLTTLGFYSLTQRIIGIPSRVIGNSFSQVYFQRATQEYQNFGHSNVIFFKSLKKLFIIALPVFIILFFIAEPAFALVFGEKWRIAGTYAQILVPLALIRFVSSALSITVSIHQQQQYGLSINVILLFTTITIFYFANLNQIDFDTMLKYLSFVLSIEYLLFLYLYYKISKSRKNL